jgi:hypothetical protein
MLDTVGIAKFNYNPRANHSEAAVEDAWAREASTEDAKATSAMRDPNPTIDPQGEIR